MKKLLISVSMVAILSTQALASRQIVNQEVDRDLDRNGIIRKLLRSHDYTIDTGEQTIVNRALREIDNRRVRGVNTEAVTQMTKERITQNLDEAKDSHASLGNGYYVTKNKRNDPSVESGYNVLKYPIFASKREESDAFLPWGYQGNELSQALYTEVRDYAISKGMSQSNTNRLYKYLEPLFYIVEDEILMMRDGDANRHVKGIKGVARWVYEKGYEGILNSIKNQMAHHLYMIQNAGLSGLNEEEVKNALTESVFKKGLALLPSPERSIYSAGNRQYYIGVNRGGQVSLIHPDCEELAYPFFADHRSRKEGSDIFPLGDMNLPRNFQTTPFLQKQWGRIEDFVLLNKALSSKDQRRAKILLEPMGYIARSLLKDMDPDFSKITMHDLMDFALLSFNDQQERQFFRTLAPRLFSNTDIQNKLDGLSPKIGTHVYLTGDLWPSRFDSNQAKEEFVGHMLNYLLYQELKEKLSSSWPARKNLLLQEEQEKSNTLRLTQERLLSKEGEVHLIQTRLEESERDKQHQLRLAQERERTLRTQVHMAREDVANANRQLEETRLEYEQIALRLQETIEDVERQRGLAQRQIEETNLKQAELEKTLIKQGIEKEEAIRQAQETLREEREQAEKNLRQAHKLAEKEIKEREDLLRAAERRADAAELRAAKAEEGLAEALNLLDENRAKMDMAERSNRNLMEKLDLQSNDIALLQKTIFEQDEKFSKQLKEQAKEMKEFYNLHFTQLDEANRALKYRTEQYEQLKAFRLSEAMSARKNIDQLDQKLEMAEGRLKNAEILLFQQKEAARLAQEEADNKYTLLQKAKEDEFEKLDQLYKAAKSEADKLSEVVVNLTAELEDIRYEQAEILSLYEQAKFQVKEATARYEKAEDELKALADLSSISLNNSLNNSPFEKDNIGIIKQVNLMGLEDLLVHEEQFKSKPNMLNPFLGQFPINFGGMNQTVHSNSMNEGMGMKPFKKLDDMTVYQSEYGYNDSKGNFQPFDDSKSFAESKLISQSVLKENPQIKEQIKKESEDIIDLSSLHIHDKSKVKSESESFEVIDNSQSFEDPKKKK
jgi:hypothetical protein